MQYKYQASSEAENTDVFCDKCNEKVVLQSFKLEYLGSVFPVDLPSCPVCNQVYISEELATNKMFDVEQSLEDK